MSCSMSTVRNRQQTVSEKRSLLCIFLQHPYLCCKDIARQWRGTAKSLPAVMNSDK